MGTLSDWQLRSPAFDTPADAPPDPAYKLFTLQVPSLPATFNSDGDIYIPDWDWAGPPQFAVLLTPNDVNAVFDLLDAALAGQPFAPKIYGGVSALGVKHNDGNSPKFYVSTEEVWRMEAHYTAVRMDGGDLLAFTTNRYLADGETLQLEGYDWQSNTTTLIDVQVVSRDGVTLVYNMGKMGGWDTQILPTPPPPEPWHPSGYRGVGIESVSVMAKVGGTPVTLGVGTNWTATLIGVVTDEPE